MSCASTWASGLIGDGVGPVLGEPRLDLAAAQAGRRVDLEVGEEGRWRLGPGQHWPMSGSSFEKGCETGEQRSCGRACIGVASRKMAGK